MSVQTENEPVWGTLAKAASVGAVAGFAGGVLMGILLQFGTELLPVIGGLTGQRSVLRGWTVNLAISVLYGVLFSIVIAYPGLERVVPIETTGEHVLVGVVYATIIAAITVAVLPFAFEVLEATGAVSGPFPRVPGPTGGALVSAMVFALAHIGYGAVLGGTYTLLEAFVLTD